VVGRAAARACSTSAKRAVANKLGRSLDQIFPHDVIHIENLGGAIDEVLDRRIHFGCFPWRFQGGEAALCRAVAFLD
jgi:kynurenine formamidase